MTDETAPDWFSRWKRFLENLYAVYCLYDCPSNACVVYDLLTGRPLGHFSPCLFSIPDDGPFLGHEPNRIRSALERVGAIRFE